jgi:hypothetical protein
MLINARQWNYLKILPQKQKKTLVLTLGNLPKESEKKRKKKGLAARRKKAGKITKKPWY